MATNVERIISKFAEEALAAQQSPLELKAKQDVAAEIKKRKQNGILNEENIARLEQIYRRLQNSDLDYEDAAWMYLLLQTAMIECGQLWKKTQELTNIAAAQALKSMYRPV